MLTSVSVILNLLLFTLPLSDILVADIKHPSCEDALRIYFHLKQSTFCGKEK